LANTTKNESPAVLDLFRFRKARQSLSNDGMVLLDERDGPDIPQILFEPSRVNKIGEEQRQQTDAMLAGERLDSETLFRSKKWLQVYSLDVLEKPETKDRRILVRNYRRNRLPNFRGKTVTRPLE
jgi:hypothetical protein